MSFEGALRAAAARACSAASQVALSGSVELDPEEVSVPRGLAWSFWDTRGRSDLAAEVSLGVGAARVVTASGPQRLEEARAALAATLKDIERLDAAPPRAFGGLGFEPDAPGPFAALGDLRFTIPRWTFTRHGTATRVTLVAEPWELARTETLLEELRALRRPRAKPSVGPITLLDDGKARFLAAAQSAVARVEARELDKVVVVRRAVLEGGFDPRAVLGALAQEVRATRFGFSDGTLCFVGATPELLVRWDGSRVQSEAVAGTLARARDPEELRRSAKDRLEHDYVVQAVQSALASVRAELEPPGEPQIRSLRHVHHLVTPIAGRLREPRHVLELVAALHPTPAVLGVPADAARAFLRRAEHFPRGWFAAPVGCIEADGSGSFVVALRSALLSRGRAWLYAGSGVVRGSAPGAELAETDAKLMTMLAALGAGRAPEPRAESAL
ncbi:MAG: isochorismate synthase [Myxococcales bacterium]|nr:isochorismate synthase [Myxococcales bacterium]